MLLQGRAAGGQGVNRVFFCVGVGLLKSVVKASKG